MQLPFVFAIKNRRLLGFVQTEVQDGQPCGAILVQTDDNTFVTAWYRSGDGSWAHGRYVDNYQEAFVDFLLRAAGWGPRVPAPQKSTVEEKPADV